MSQRYELQTKINDRWVNFFKSKKTYKSMQRPKKIMWDLFEYQRLTNKKFDLRVKAVKVSSCKHCGSVINKGQK